MNEWTKVTLFLVAVGILIGGVVGQGIRYCRRHVEIDVQWVP